MDNTGYEINGLSMFDNNPVDTAINDNPDTVKVYGNQTINGDKSFNGTVTINNEIVHNSTSFSTTDGIIEQLKGNTGDLLDYGNYAEYNDGTSTKYKGMINKKETDKFYVFHNQTNQPSTSLNLGTQDLGTILTRDPVEAQEVATKAYVESHGGGSYLPLSGGSMNGDIDMNIHDVLNAKKISLKPIAPGEPTYFDFTSADGGRGKLFISNIGRFEKSTNPTFTRVQFFIKLQMDDKIFFSSPHKIEGLANGTASGDAVNKAQLDEKLDLSGGTLLGQINMSNNNISNINELSFDPQNQVKIRWYNQDGPDETYTTEFQPYTIAHRTGRNIAFYKNGSFVDTELNPGTGGTTFLTMEGDNGNKVKIHNLLDMNGQDIINCNNIRPQGTSLQLLSQNQAGGIRIFDTLIDIFSDMRMNNNNISFLGEPTLSHQATTKQYVDNAVNGGGDVHLPKYHTVFYNPSPDSGETYKTYTNDGFFGQAVFDCVSPVMSTTSGYVLWNINIPPLFFFDALVDFIVRIKEGNTYVENIQAGATYNGSVGSGYRTLPIVTKGCHEFQTTDPTVILSVEVWCKPRTAINGTAKMDLTSGNDLFKMYRVADFELININP